MGFGIGAAIGAAVGTHERSVLITGDGSFGMSLQELATAVTYNIPVVILILNNSVLGMVRQWQTLFFDKHYSNTTLNRKTDFAAVAKAFGADGEKVLNWTRHLYMRLIITVRMLLIAVLIKTNLFFLCFLPEAVWTIL